MNESNNETMQRRKLISLISLSMRAGKIVSGEDSCVKALQSGRARVVFVASDASDNTRKKFADKSSYYGVPCYSYFSKADIESSIGKPNRATIICTCDSFAARMQELLSNLEIRTYLYEDLN